MPTITQVLNSYPILPYPMQIGSLNWSEKIEDYPTGEITYKGNSLEMSKEIADAYPNLKEFTVANIGFAVSPGGVSVKRSRYGRGDVEVYDVSVQLQSKWKAKCQRKISLSAFFQRDLFSRFRYATGVNVSAIADFLGLPYIGPAIFYQPESLETTFEEILKSNSRRLGCFVQFSDANVVRLVAIDGVQSWTFPDSIVIDDGQEKRIPALPTIDNIAISGKFSLDPFDQEDKLLLPIEPKVEVIVAGGRKLSSLGFINEAQTLTAKESSGTIKTLDLNFDASGPKKTYSETTFIDGVIQEELIKVYGYKYRAIDVGEKKEVGGKPVIVQPLKGIPSQWWMQIEEQLTTYEYKEIPVEFDISATTFGQNSKAYVNPDSAKILAGSGNSVTLNNAKYLVGSKMTGWKYVRLKKEGEGTYESNYYTPPKANEAYYTARYAARLCDWERIPLEGKTAFEIKPMRSLYPLTTPFPIEVQVQKYSELSQDTIARAKIPPKYKLVDGIEQIDPEYTVAIVSAKQGEAEPYYVLSESSFKSCFTFGKSPEFNPDLPANVRAKAKDAGKPEYIFAGEEAYSSSVRQIFEFDFDGKGIRVVGAGNGLQDKGEAYTELVASDVAQGSNFVEVEQDAKAETKKGKPPTAQVMLSVWGNAKEKAKTESRTDYRKSVFDKYYAVSDLVNDYPADTVLRYTANSELDLPLATTIAEAKTILETDLRMVAIANAVSSKKIAWYYPSLRCGDKLSFSKSNVRATNVSHSLEYRGLQNGKLLVVCDGAQVECGYDQPRTVTISQSTYARNSDGAIAPNIRISARSSEAGSFIYNESKRRSFR